MNKQANVLFVDDEVNILKSIRREFFDAPFTVLTANSGTEGLKIIQENPIDLVISDIKMPEMDGITFLEQVKKTTPHINRVILSGYVEQSSVIHAIVRGVASSYIAKPWQSEELRKNIDQILHLRKHLIAPTLMSVLTTIDRLPSLPTVYQDFLQAIEQESSTKVLAAIISQDVSMSARILQVANSAFYGTCKISSLERALIQLGTNAIKDIVLTVSVTGQMNWNPVQLRLLLEIFKHSALVSRLNTELHLLLTQKRLAEADSSAALTHDIGKIILLQYFPDIYLQINKKYEQDPEKKFYTAEKNISQLSVSHCDIGAYFLSRWNLPQSNIAAALFHHDPEQSQGSDNMLIHMIALANQLAPLLPVVNEQKWIEMTRDTIFATDQRQAFLARALEISS